MTAGADIAPGLLRAVCLFVPLALTIGLAYCRRPPVSVLAGALLATLWNLPALLGVHLLAERFGWWSLAAEGGLLEGLPVDLWLGWALLWGAVPQLAFPNAPLLPVAVLAVWLDLLLMPLLEPVVVLAGGWRWLAGEAVAVAVALLPALLLGRWTAQDRRLAARVALQVVLAGGLSLWLLPVVAFAATGGQPSWPAGWPAWRLGLAFQLLAVPAVVALSAVQEFAARGGGTPLPYDPPRRLVASGPYAYVANPMQAGMALLLAGWGALLGSWWVAAAAPMSIAYGAGLAAWHEGEQLGTRFGERWAAYRRAVRPWWPRWRPYVPDGEPAVLYVAATCAACSEIGAWLAGRRPAGLRLVPAETLQGAPAEAGVRRLTYVADGRTERGMAAFARAIEHLHLGWALLAWVLRLPGVCWLAQLVADAVGAGPRDLEPARPWRAPWAS